MTAPSGIAAADADRVTDSLSGALSVADRVPAEIVEAAQQAFTAGVNIASLAAGGAILVAVVLSLVTLRHVGTLGHDMDTTHETK